MQHQLHYLEIILSPIFTANMTYWETLLFNSWIIKQGNIIYSINWSAKLLFWRRKATEIIRLINITLFIFCYHEDINSVSYNYAYIIISITNLKKISFPPKSNRWRYFQMTKAQNSECSNRSCPAEILCPSSV